jgi:hypothetical protein
VPVGDFVANAERFAQLAASFSLSFDDFIRTSTDPRHVPAVQRLWEAVAARGNLYLRTYQGHYCASRVEATRASSVESSLARLRSVPKPGAFSVVHAPFVFSANLDQTVQHQPHASVPAPGPSTCYDPTQSANPQRARSYRPRAHNHQGQSLRRGL